MLLIWLKSIFSFSIYHLLGKTSAWRTAFFMLYLTLVGILVFNIYFAYQVHQNLPIFIQHFPTLTFTKGRLITQDKKILSIPGTDQSIIFAPEEVLPPSKEEFVEKQVVAFIRADRFYMPTVTGVSSQLIPPEIDGQINAQTLQTYAPTLRSLLQTFAFIGAFLIVGGFFIFSFLMAWTVCFFWRNLMRAPVALSTLTRWAVFLQGPVLVLWIIHLCIGVPLFFLAVFILLNIYVQQIFNTLPDNRGSYVA